MATPSHRPDRALYNRARVPLPLSSSAGSAAWSLAGRGSLPRPEDGVRPVSRVEPGDRSLPIVHRN